MQPAMACAMHHLLPWNVYGEVHKGTQDFQWENGVRGGTTAASEHAHTQRHIHTL